jgi:type II restriction enzyme
MRSYKIVQLGMSVDVAAGYRSNAQRVRIISEAWAGENLYCPCCPSNTIERCRNNREAVDYTCRSCDSLFQLKSSQSHSVSRIVDGAFAAMMRAIAQGAAPNLLVLHYDPSRWEVKNLTLIPNFAFTSSCIEKRRALSVNARRAGWVGCNILLCNIPPDVRISWVENGVVTTPREVRKKFRSLSSFASIAPAERGWTLDALQVVRTIGKREFRLADVYAHAAELQALHPNNRHVRDKIRQQLQILRDLGFLQFLGGGNYRTLR